MSQSDSSAGPRAPLSKERVLRAAMDLADAEGLDRLSMRRLAKELGVEAMSLYNHVANKSEIFSGMLEVVVAEIELPSAADDWKVAMRRNAISTRDVLRRHAWASSLWMSSQSGGPAQLRRTDWILRTFREAGLSPDLVYHALHILEAYALGATVQHQSFPYSREEIAGMADTFLRQLPAEEYPDLVDHVKQHLDPPTGAEGGFELGLDLILTGLERLRDTA